MQTGLRSIRCALATTNGLHATWTDIIRNQSKWNEVICLCFFFLVFVAHRKYYRELIYEMDMSVSFKWIGRNWQSFFILDSTWPTRQSKQPIIYATLAAYSFRNYFGNAVMDAMWPNPRNKFRCDWWHKPTKLKSHGALTKVIGLMLSHRVSWFMILPLRMCVCVSSVLLFLLFFSFFSLQKIRISVNSPRIYAHAR